MKTFKFKYLFLIATLLISFQIDCNANSPHYLEFKQKIEKTSFNSRVMPVSNCLAIAQSQIQIIDQATWEIFTTCGATPNCTQSYIHARDYLYGRVEQQLSDCEDITTIARPGPINP